jgi:hypothetical protein
MVDCLALFFIGLLMYELATGKVTDRSGRTILRRTHPIAYWINAAAGIIIGLFLLLLVVHDLYRWSTR